MVLTGTPHCSATEVTQPSLSLYYDIGVEDGKVMFGFSPSEAHYNPIGTVHGGLGCT